jgi:hypothetical protein
MISTTHCVTEVVFLRKLVEELGFNQVSTTIIYEDNNDCITLGNTGHFKVRSSHIDLSYMFLSDYIPRGLIKFERVDSKNQVADIGTVQDPGRFSKGIVLFTHSSLLVGSTRRNNELCERQGDVLHGHSRSLFSKS